MIERSKKSLAIGGIILAFSAGITTWAAENPQWGTAGWIQFPTNDEIKERENQPNIAITSNARLALTAQGGYVGMTYTPATYEIHKDPGREYIELQIHDGSLIASAGAQGDYVGASGAWMDLVFDDPLNSLDWEIKCTNSDPNGSSIAANAGKNRLKISTEAKPCIFRKSAWSDTLRIYTGSKNILRFKTVWDDAKENEKYGKSNHSDLINVFRFQAKNGTIKLTQTNVNDIKLNSGGAVDIEKHLKKSEYESSLNWTVLYNTSADAFYWFEADVTGMDYLYLWDKDADANRLWNELKGEPQISKPKDDGIKMLVRWSDGDPVKYQNSEEIIENGISITSSPEWTFFDQSIHPELPKNGAISYEGPGWDTDKDPTGEKSIQLYKIPLQEHKSNKVMIIWYGSAVPNNGLAFAASGVVETGCTDSTCEEEDPEEPPPEENTEDKENICPENEDPECTEITEEGNLKLQTTIGSTPPPETDHLKEKGITEITYTLTIKNIGEETIEDLQLDFTAPEFTLIDSTPLLDRKTFAYGDLPADSTINQEFTVIIDGDAPDEGTISTAGKLLLSSSNLSDHRPKTIRHYLGDKPIDPNDPSIPKCTESGNLRSCIISTPLPDPSPQSFGLDAEDPENNSITYHITIENISDAVTLQNINIGFEPPAFTSLDPSQIASIIPLEGSGSYTGKGPGRFDLAGSLAPQTSISKDITIILDTDTPSKNFDISSEDLITAGAQNNPAVTLPKLLHHAGLGAVNIQVTRCYAYDYFGGEFTCDLSCRTVEPGTSITVRDLVTNIGGETAFDQTYFPPPLSSHFEYEPQSIRIDDPSAGITATNDGDSFPPPGGITIPGPLEPNQGRAVYFKYFIPPEILEEEPPPEGEEDSSCYPDEDEELSLPEGQTITTPIEYEADCPGEGEATEEGAENGRICVKVEPNPLLDLELTAVPSPTNTVYQGSIITYFLTIRNSTKQAVEELIIEGSIPAQTVCKSGNCTGLIVNDPLELKDNFSTITYSFSVQVMDNAAGTSIVHPGITIRYSGGDGSEQVKKSNAITHPLLAAPEPTGDFQHDITLNRKTVLNSKDGSPRTDQGDKSEISHSFTFAGTKKSPVWPSMTGYRNFSYNVCRSPYSPSYEYYDANWNASTINYNSTNRTSPLTSFDSIGRSPITFQITTDLPDERPELVEYTTRSHQHQFTYTLPPEAVNSYMKDGRTIPSTDLQKTVIRGVRDGDIGEINTENIAITTTVQKAVPEDQWIYTLTNYRTDSNRCRYCRKFGCSYYSPSVPVYRWVMTNLRNVPQANSDKDYITVLTSVAWLQTKYGNLGFGTNFWQTTPGSGDPNLVNLGDKIVPTTMKFYTPPNEYNADLFVYSPDGNDPLISRLGSSGKITFGSLEQGFITSPTEESDRQLSRGEAYDRENYPREYYDDLLNREVFGEVIRLNSASTLPAGMSRNGNEFYLNGTGIFASDTIYHIKGNLTIGTLTGSKVSIDGGKARLFVEGNISILNNIAYAKKSDADLSKIPSLRVHATNNISISPSVSEIELMMLAEKEFHSGRSDQQLRILGDVIAYKTFWERSPLNEERENEDMINKPSEIIYEDFRKYILTPPGDKKLPDTGHMWREVNPSTGRPILESLLSE